MPIEVLDSVYRTLFLKHNKYTYLFLLLVEVVNDDTNKEVQGEKRPKDDEAHKVEIHIETVLHLWLIIFLQE